MSGMPAFTRGYGGVRQRSRPRVCAALSLVMVLTAVAALAWGCGSRPVTARRRVVVLGIDGMDYQLVRDLMVRGRMPQFGRLAKSGRFSALATSTPPQSPVAWSTFITGRDPGSHGVFDFIHRDPKTMEAFLSTSRTDAAARRIVIGGWQFPLERGRVEL